jgi:CRISPR-associated protein Cas1
VDETLWPARNVAEYAYCPRLFYYMEVEGIHAPSEDTLEGIRVHRRVDQPSAEPGDDDESRDEERPQAVRSLTLTSACLGLTATLDLAELRGQTAVPVEYRKGRPRHLEWNGGRASGRSGDGPAAVELWPTDRVQVGLQAILLEEAGYTVTEAVVYYAAEKRRVRVAVDEALRREALDTLAAAKECAAGPRPLPLVNDARCPKCSLQPICLPDEVNQQREADGSGEVKPRKIWPPRDDGIHVVVQENGTKVGVRGQAMQVTDKDGTKLKDVPLAGVESVSLLGTVQISTQALHVLADKGIPVAFLTAAGRIAALVDPLDSVSADTRRAQVREFDKPGRCLELARALIAAKIANQRTLLMRNYSAPAQAVDPFAAVPAVLRSADGALAPDCLAADPVAAGSPDPSAQHDRRSPLGPGDLRSGLRRGRETRAEQETRAEPGGRAEPGEQGLPARVAEELATQVEQAARAASLESIRGHEGQAAAIYFEHFAGMIKSDVAAAFDAHGRQRRPAPDPVNAALSFAYSMLTHECTAALRVASLEPSIGAFHVSRPGRPALSLDLLEPFRPLIADSIVITAFNRGELKAGHFLRTAAGCAFTDAGRKAFFAVYGRRMADEVTHPVFGYRLSYRRMIVLHARMIAAWVVGEVPGLAFLTTR